MSWLPHRLRAWLIGSVLIFVFGLMLSWAVGDWMVRSNRSHVAPAEAPARDFRISIPDGTSLAATYWPGRRPSSPAVLLLHGNDGSRGVLKENAAWLASHGYAVLTADFRGHGQSSDATHSFGWEESRDARASFAWLKHRQHGARVAIVGISLGGAASLLGEHGPVPADAMVLQVVYPEIRRAIRNRIADRTTSGLAYLLEPLLSFQSRLRFGIWPARLSPIAAIGTLQCPVFVIGGNQDRFTPPAETRELFAAAGGPKQLWLVDGFDHAAMSVLQTEEYRQRLLAFFTRTIGPG